MNPLKTSIFPHSRSYHGLKITSSIKWRNGSLLWPWSQGSQKSAREHCTAFKPVANFREENGIWDRWDLDGVSGDPPVLPIYRLWLSCRSPVHGGNISPWVGGMVMCHSKGSWERLLPVVTQGETLSDYRNSALLMQAQATMNHGRR